MRQWLDVPFADKDLAKRCGARWDDVAKRWYAPRPGMRGLERWAARPDLPALLPGEDRTFGEGLFVDLVPETAWWTHVRYCMSGQDWERIRRMVTRRAGLRCEACGRGEDGSRGVWLEAHERWAFDTGERRQVLRRLVCLCTGCHRVTHYGLSQLRGEAEPALAHLCAVTGMTWRDAELHVSEAFEVWQRRSLVQWDLDLTMITSAGVTIVRPAGSAAERAQTARELTHRDAPPSAPRSVAVGSRWQRWLETGER